jgi:signal transduction histidine kinase
VIVTGALIAAAGMYWLSRIPVHGTYLHDLLPGMLVLAFGFGPVFVGVTTAANAGVPADKAGLAASLLNASQQLGGALGLAIFTAVATGRTHHQLAAHNPPAQALTAGFGRALLVGSIFILAAAIIALRATNTRGEAALDQPEADQPIQDATMSTPVPACDCQKRTPHDVVIPPDSEARAAGLAQRQRPAREMHDVLARSLSGLLLQLEGARMLADENPGDTRLPDVIDRAHQLGFSQAAAAESAAAAWLI